MTRYTLSKLTPLNQNMQKFRFCLERTSINGESIEKTVSILGFTLEDLAQKCFTTTGFSISENDAVLNYNGPTQRFFSDSISAYVISSPTPEELVSFLLEYHHLESGHHLQKINNRYRVEYTAEPYHSELYL